MGSYVHRAQGPVRQGPWALGPMGSCPPTPPVPAWAQQALDSGPGGGERPRGLRAWPCPRRDSNPHTSLPRRDVPCVRPSGFTPIVEMVPELANN